MKYQTMKSLSYHIKGSRKILKKKKNKNLRLVSVKKKLVFQKRIPTQERKKQTEISLSEENNCLKEQIQEQIALNKILIKLVKDQHRQTQDKLTQLGGDVASIQNVLEGFVKSELSKKQKPSKNYFIFF